MEKINENGRVKNKPGPNIGDGPQKNNYNTV